MTAVPYRAILVTVVAAVIPLLGVAVARLAFDVDISRMTMDVPAITKIHPLSGILSSLGALVWWTSVAIWFFAALLRLRQHPGTANVGFMVSSGLLSTYLALDDLFQIHEYIAPLLLNIPDEFVLGLLALAVILYLWMYRRLLYRPDGALLLLALAFLGVSLVIDMVLEPWLWRLKDWEYFIEDGAKWLGICFWTAFCVVRCSSDLAPISSNSKQA